MATRALRAAVLLRSRSLAFCPRRNAYGSNALRSTLLPYAHRRPRRETAPNHRSPRTRASARPDSFPLALSASISRAVVILATPMRVPLEKSSLLARPPSIEAREPLLSSPLLSSPLLHGSPLSHSLSLSLSLSVESSPFSPCRPA